MNAVTLPLFWETLLLTGLPAWVAVSQFFYWTCVKTGLLTGDSKRRMNTLLDICNLIAAILAAIALIVFIKDIGMTTTLVITIALVLLFLVGSLAAVKAHRNARDTNTRP